MKKSFRFITAALAGALLFGLVSCKPEVKIVEVEVSTVPEDGDYTIYHIQQGVSGGNAFRVYTQKESEKKSLTKGFKLADLSKEYTGFYIKNFTLNEDAIYIFYDRKTIEYTFNTGAEGTFKDGTTTKKVTGLYEQNVVADLSVISETKDLNYWISEEGEEKPAKFGEKNLSFNAVWVDKLSPGTIDYSKAIIGDIILDDGSICRQADFDSSNMTPMAIVIRAQSEDLPVLAMGINVGSYMEWCKTDAEGMKKIPDLIGDFDTGLLDGSKGWDIMKTECSDFESESSPEKYPAWYYCHLYGTNNSLTHFQDGWYFPTLCELKQIFDSKDTVNTALKTCTNKDLDSMYAYRSCSQQENNNQAYCIYNYGKICGSNTKGYHDGGGVIAVRVFE